MSDRSEDKRRWLAEHERLSRLFVQDRLSFERERSRLINETIQKNPSETRRNRLIALQKRWDTILRHACSEYNRFELIQMLFWDQVQNVWLPALNDIKCKFK